MREGPDAGAAPMTTMLAPATARDPPAREDGRPADRREPETLSTRPNTQTTVANSFRTATGRCVVVDGAVRFEDDDAGRLGTLREALTADEIPAWRRAATVLCFVALLAGVVLVVRVVPAWLVGAAAGLLLAAYAWGWYTGRDRPAGDDAEMPLDDVVGVEAHGGIPLLTRPRFVVRYRSEGGVKHRYVACPSRVYGFGSYRTGRELFDRRGLLVGEESDRERLGAEA